MNVVIEYQETRKPYVWRKAAVAKVLYADRGIILVVSGGRYSTFCRSGWRSISLPAGSARHKDWRIKPDDMKRIRSRQTIGGKPGKAISSARWEA